MSIATVDDLTALDPGTEIVITSPVNGKATWSKTDDGRFRHVATGAFVQAGVFVGSVVAGQVVLAAEDPPQVGEVFQTTSGTYLYVILEVAQEEGTTVIHAGRFRHASWYGLHRLNQANFAGTALTRVAAPDRPDWMELVIPMADTIHRQNQAARGYLAQIAALHAQPVPEPLIRDLHEWARDATDDDFDQMLVNHNIGRERSHVSTVSITGTVTPDPERVAEWMDLGPDFSIDDIQASVAWSRSEDVTRDGVGCTCSDITEDDIRPFLPPAYRNLDWSVECA